jgi:septum formation protein
MDKNQQSGRIVLASASPRRKYLLTELGFSFTVDPSRVDESVIPFQNDRQFAIQAAMAKASEVAARYTKGELVIGADTIVCLEDRILGKPRDLEEARSMLLRLRSRGHIVITGIAVVEAGTGNVLLDSEKTEVFFKRFQKKTLESYLETGDSLDKAGAYGIQGAGECLIHHIRGDYFNVMGLPLQRLLGLVSNVMDVSPQLERLGNLRRPF